MSEDWCAEQFANLHIKERRLDTLNQIRSHLKNVVPDKAPNFPKFLTLLDSIEDCGDNVEQVHLTCDILCICMSNLEISSSEWCYFTYLERCFQYRNDDIKLLALNDVERRLNDYFNGNSSVSLTSLYRTQTLVGIASCIESGETQVAMVAIRILLKLLPTTNDDKPIRMRLEQTLEQKDLVRCRLYELGVKLSNQSPVMHDKYQFILDRLIADLQIEDILLQVTTLNFTSDIASTEHGYIYLENKGTFEKILQLISRLEANPFKSILIPSYLKFFGCIAAVQPAKIIRGFPEMIHSLFDCINNGDPSTFPVAYDTLGQLARTSDGKILLDELYSRKLQETFVGIGKTINNLPTPLKIRALNSLHTVFQCEPSNYQNNQIGSITEQWFVSLNGAGNLAFIHSFCKNPFPEIKLASLALLRSICKYPWGQIALIQTAGLIEYLLDRKAEFDKDIMHEKYVLLKDLSSSIVFDTNIGEQINRYIADGAFYVQGITEVAIDGC